MVTITQNLSSTKTLTAKVWPELSITVTTLPQAPTSALANASPLYDSVLKLNTSSGSYTNYQIDGPTLGSYTLESLDPSLASISGNTVMKVGSGGSVQVRVSRGAASQLVTCNTAQTVTSLIHFDTYAPGSLARLLADNVLNLITTGKTENYFTDYANGGQASFTKNTTCWAAGIDLSGCAVDTSIFGGYSSANKGGLITDQHLLGAKHWNAGVGFSIGNNLRFRGSDGTIHTRSVIGLVRDVLDMIVVTLSSPLPSTVKPFKLVGQWLWPYADNHYHGGVFFYADQQWRCRLLLGYTTQTWSNAGETITTNGVSIAAVTRSISFVDQWAPAPLSLFSTLQRSLHQGGVTGDSGSAILVYNGVEAGLCGTFHGSTYCPYVGAGNGAVANQLIAMADANAVSLGNMVSPTNKTVTMMPMPTP